MDKTERKNIIGRIARHVRPSVVVEKTRKEIEKRGPGFFITLIVFFSMLSILIFVEMEYIYAFVIVYGVIGIFVFSILSDLFITPFGVDMPFILMLIASSPMMDVYAYLAVMLGVIFATVVAYIIGIKWGSVSIESMLGKKTYEKFTENKKYGKMYMFISALSPLPYIPYLAGVYKLNMKECFFYLVLPRGIRYGFYWLIVSLFGGAILSWF